MEDAIDASPTSQKKRKKISRCRTTQSKLKVNEGDNTQNVITVDQNNSSVTQANNVSDCLPHKDIWQSAYLLEEANKAPVATQKTRMFNRCNRTDFRVPSIAGFVRMSQVCPTTSSNADEAKLTQWDLTESQFRKLDDAIKDSENGTANLVQMEIKDEANDFSKPAERITDENTNSLRRRSSLVQSILSDWPTSPVKIRKTESESVQLSPKFVLNRRQIKTTYLRNRNAGETRNLLPEIKKSSQTTEAVGLLNNAERCQPQIPSTDVNDDVEDLNNSMNIVDNIQNLSKFYTQSSEPTSVEHEVNETFRNVMDLKNLGLSKPSDSLDDEEDFLGFDSEPITLPERFYEFASNLDSSLSSSNSITNATDDRDRDLFPEEDDDLFANFKTQPNGQCISNYQANVVVPVLSTSAVAMVNGGLHNRKMSVELFQDDINSHISDAGVTMASDLETNIEREFDILLQRRGKSLEEPSVSASISNAKRNSLQVSSVTRPDNFKKFKISDDVPELSNDFFAKIDRDCDFEPAVLGRNTEINPSTSFAGFTTAGGKPIPVSTTLISKKTNIFRNVEVSAEDLKQMNTWIEDSERNDSPSTSAMLQQSNSISIPAFTGFTTAGGKPMSVSPAIISKQKNIFRDVDITGDDLTNMCNWMDDMKPGGEPHINDPVEMKRNLDLNQNSAFAGFTTARGKQIQVSSAMISKQQNIFQNEDFSADDLKAMDSWIDNSKGNDDPSFSSMSKQNNFSPAFAGFTTAKGSKIPVSSALISKKTNIFDNVDVTADELSKMNNWINTSSMSETTTNGIRQMPISLPLLYESANNVNDLKLHQSNGTDRFRELTNIAHKEPEAVSKKASVNTFVKPSPMRRMSMMNSLRKLETQKENVDRKSTKSVNPTSESPINSTSSSTSSNTYICVTPTNNPKTYTQEGRDSAAIIMQDDELFLANKDSKEQTPGFVLTELTASSTPIQRVDGIRNRPKQRRLVETFDDIAAEECFESNIPLETFKIQVPDDIKSLRAIAFADQHRSIATKTNVKRVPSSLYIKKLTSAKVNWKELVEHERPANNIEMDSKLTDSVLNVTAENATKFKFNAWDYYSDEFCRENINGIHLHDDIVVMMDGNCQIGLNEISTAFLSCPSVDPKLMHHKWIENNMKWIVLKLAAMERSFPNRFAGQVLTLENLMLQMKYRYEREIDRAERSAIRKICEMDDIAAKRMVLFVAGITRKSFESEVELSDGWYSLMSTFEYKMERLVDKGKIKVGTKLVIQGATTPDLVNGCHPLDVAGNVKLKIHANSTRRARWDTKLGYCKNPGPFPISLRSVQGSGGNIPKLRICALRVYPVVYIDPKKLSDVHSEKVERRLSLKDEREKLTIIENIYGQVSREFEEEEKAARSENRPNKIVKLVKISTITDPAYLCDLIDYGNDPTRIESEMTQSQKKMLLEYKDKLNCSRDETIRSRVNEKLASIDKNTRKFVPLLRFKITDGLSFDKTALVTVWKPTEEILSMIKEGIVFDLTGSSTRGISCNELQIYAGKGSHFTKLNAVSSVPVSLHRRHSSISEILSVDKFNLNELDTTGLVVHVGEISHKFQPVFIADCDQNIVCINFYESVKAFAYDDVVQRKRFLAVKNLQWRKSSNSQPIPCTYATEYSLFTENPQSSELSIAIENLKTQFSNVDLDTYIDACMEKVRSHNLSFQTTPGRSASMSSLQSSGSSGSLLAKTPSDITLRPGRSSLSNQSRMEQLSKYGEPMMATPPMHISSLNKNYKLPVSKT